MISILKDFYGFLRSPSDLKQNINNHKRIALVPLILKLFLISFLVGIFAFVIKTIAVLIIVQLGFEPSDFNHQIEAKNILKEQLPLYLLLYLGGIQAPFFEELIFRKPLKYSRFNLILAVFLFLLLKLIVNELIRNEQIETNNIFLLILIPITMFKILSFKKINIALKSFWKNQFGIIFYGLACIFAILHFSGNKDIFALIDVLPQFIIGLFFGFIRMKYGLTFSIVIHMLSNLLFISASIIFNSYGL